VYAFSGVGGGSGAPSPRFFGVDLVGAPATMPELKNALYTSATREPFGQTFDADREFERSGPSVIIKTVTSALGTGFIRSIPDAGRMTIKQLLNTEGFTDVFRQIQAGPTQVSEIELAMMLEQQQLPTDYAARISDAKQGAMSDNITASEVVPQAGVQGGTPLFDYLNKQKRNWLGKYIGYTFGQRGIVPIPSAEVISIIGTDTIPRLITSGDVSVLKYMFIVLCDRFPAYLGADVCRLIDQTSDTVFVQGVQPVIQDLYGADDECGQFLRDLSVYVKAVAQVSQPLDFGLTQDEQIVCLVCQQLRSRIDQEYSRIVSDNVNTGELTAGQLKSLDNLRKAMVDRLYEAVPVFRIASLNVSDIPRPIFARIRAQSRQDASLTPRLKALAVRAWRVANLASFYAFVSNTSNSPADWKPLAKS
jgi:hypothetical protein